MTPVGSLDGEKIAESVLLQYNRISSTASLLCTSEALWAQELSVTQLKPSSDPVSDFKFANVT